MKSDKRRLPLYEPERSAIIEAELMPIPLEIARSRGYLAYEARFIQCETMFKWNCKYANDCEKTIDEHRKIVSGIARNECNKEYRTRVRLPSLPENVDEYIDLKSVDDLVLVIHTTFEESDRRSLHAAFDKEVEAKLEGCSENTRKVFELVALHNWSHAQVAEELGISAGSSKVMLFNARKALRPIAEKYYTQIFS